VRKALFGLGFRECQLHQPAATLSGGERTRVMLARLLLGDHDLLLLDEPTSHLDIGMLEWLEKFLQSYRGAYLAASHDRRFLDRSVTRILELDEGRLVEYLGGYSDYAVSKRVALERRKEDYILQQRQIRALREFVAAKLGWAAKAQSGPKRGRDQRGRVSEKLAKRAHAAERRIEHMELVEKARDIHSISAHFEPARRSGQIVFEARGIGKTFGERILFGDLDLTVRYGERIGIVGPNGAGKTTLLRALLGSVEPDRGEVRRGTGVEPLFLAQEQEQLKPELSALEIIESASKLTHTEARTLLACFLFRDGEVFKRVKDLSGGERVRLAVAAAVVSGANLLLLDEPTNHLDIDTRERLEDALAAYSGTILLVSHDRYLLDRLTERTISIENGMVTDYPGSYAEYRTMQAEAEKPPDLPALTGR
jgi:ATPase subunit of ABC transporter with duplicated ATPase domains